MHEGEFHIDDSLVRALIEQQYPKWSDLHLARVQSSGTVHTIYRLGEDMAVRLPRLAEFTPALERETGILPILGPRLPLSIPELVAVGAPTDAYPSSWSILKWIEGETMATRSVSDDIATATRLGEFVTAMRAVRVTGAPSTNQRGQALARSNGWTRDSIQSVAAEFDPVELTARWETALAVPEWDGRRTWIHGDLLPGNLVVRDGELSAVIDFGECSVGNPTCDLIAGWWVFHGPSREAFKQTAATDEDSWNRARGWALSGAARALSYYLQTNPAFADAARRTLRNVIEDD